MLTSIKISDHEAENLIKQFNHLIGESPNSELELVDLINTRKSSDKTHTENWMDMLEGQLLLTAKFAQLTYQKLEEKERADSKFKDEIKGMFKTISEKVDATKEMVEAYGVLKKCIRGIKWFFKKVWCLLKWLKKNWWLVTVFSGLLFFAKTGKWPDGWFK